MLEWSKLRIALAILACGLTSGALAIAGVITYWKFETPKPLRAVKIPQFASIESGQSMVVDVPVREYDYLAPFVFSTKTLDLKGNVVWSTAWMPYNPDVRYKYVAPYGLEPGLFSVMLTIDHRVNPLIRSEDDVKFLDLVVHKEEK